MTTAKFPATEGRGSGDRLLLFAEAVVGLLVVAALVTKNYGAAPTILFLLCALALGYTAWVGTRMLSSLRDPTLAVTGKVRDFERERLEGEKRLLLIGIKDLEADFGTGKMNQTEYDRLRSTAEARALEIIQKLRTSDEHWKRQAEALVGTRLPAGTGPTDAALPASQPVHVAQAPVAQAPAIQAPRAQLSAADAQVFDAEPVSFTRTETGLVCDACGFENEEDARFCAGCGRPRAKEAA